MGLLGKLFGKREPAPDWASFFSPDEYAAFESTLSRELSALGIKHEFNTAAGTVAYIYNAKPGTLGLLNIAQQCKQLPQKDWSGFLRNHLEVMMRGTISKEGLLDGLKGDFAQASKLLKLRVYPADIVAGTGANLVQWHVAEGVIAALVLDFPDSIATASDDMVNSWGVSRDVLYTTALDNIRSEGRLPSFQMDLPSGAVIELLEEEHGHFGASHALFLDGYLAPAPELGALVALPFRQGFAYSRLGEIDPRKVLPMLALLASQLYEKGPGSITPHIFWWQNGLFTQIPYTYANDSYTFTYPLGFQETVLSRF